MPEWIERVTKEEAKSAKQLPVIPLRWERTTVPETPVRLPIPAFLNVTEHAILMHAEREEDSEYGESAEELDVQFPKKDIVSVDIFLLPEPQDGGYMRHVDLTERSRAIVRHRDPFEVVPYFESIFTCDNVYWLRAFAKAIKDRLGIKPGFFETKK